MKLPGQGESFQRKYKLHEILGKGGFAAVYRATDIDIGRDVAIKILAPSDEDGYSQGLAQRFEREARVIAGLQDPHTITMFEFGRSQDGLLYMVFEYVKGTDLSVMVKRNPIPEHTTIHIMEQVLQSLREAHAAGILHRDIKPANILIYEYMDDPHRAKLLDFGIAKPTGPGGDGQNLTSDGAMIGTPRYMAPEQIYGAQLTPASDVYSLGLVSYEMVCGRPAITGTSTKDMMVQQLSGDPVVLPPDAPVTPAMRQVIDRMTMRDQNARFGSAAEVIQALEYVRSSAATGAFNAFGMAPGSGPHHAQPHMPHGPPGQHMGAPGSGPQNRPPTGGFRQVPTGRMDAVGLPPPPAGGVHDPTPTTRPASGVHHSWSTRGMYLPNTTQRPPTQTGEGAGTSSTWKMVALGLLIGAVAVTGLMYKVYMDRDATPVTSSRKLPVGTNIVSPPSQPDAAAPSNTVAAATPDAGAEPDANVPDAAADEGFTGCGLRPGWERSKRFSNGNRSWNVHLPKNYDKNTRYPVVMLFHKAFNDAEWIMKDTRIMPLANKHKYIVIAFDALNGTTPWKENEIPVVDSAIQQASRTICIDRRRIFAVGHGAGGDLSREMACLRPLAGIATVGSGEPRGAKICTPDPPVPFLRYAGMQDKYLPIMGGTGCLGGNHKALDEIESEWRSRNSCTGKERAWAKRGKDVCATWDCSEGAPFVSCRLQGGHDWTHSHPEKFEMPGCPHPPPKFPMTEHIIKFFNSVDSAASPWP